MPRPATAFAAAALTVTPVATAFVARCGFGRYGLRRCGLGLVGEARTSGAPSRARRLARAEPLTGAQPLAEPLASLAATTSLLAALAAAAPAPGRRAGVRGPRLHQSGVWAGGVLPVGTMPADGCRRGDNRAVPQCGG